MHINFTDEQLEKLRLLLEEQYQEPVTLEEARQAANVGVEYLKVTMEIAEANPEWYEKETQKFIKENPELCAPYLNPESPSPKQ